MELTNLTLLIFYFFFNKISIGIYFLLLSYGIYSLLILEKYGKEEFKFKSNFDLLKTLIIITLFGFSFILLIIYRRFSYFNFSLDIYIWSKDFISSFREESLMSIISNIFFFFSSMILFFVIIKGLKDLLYKNFLKLHLYLLKYEKPLKSPVHIMDFEPKNPFGYYNLMKKYINFVDFLVETPYFLVKPFINIFIEKEIKYDPNSIHVITPKYGKENIHDSIRFFISCQEKDYSFYILLFSFLYDLIFNNMLINKFFLFFPFAFIFYLILLLKDFLFNHDSKILVSCEYYLDKKRFIDIDYPNNIKKFYNYDNQILYIYSNGIITNEYFLEIALDIQYTHYT